MTQVSLHTQMRRWVGMVKGMELELFKNVNNHVARSLLVGSSVTGAPGQPVDTRELIESYYRRGSIKSRSIEHGFTAKHAVLIEHNLRGATLRSKVGGFHSVKLTEMGFVRIVDHELNKLKSKFVLFDPSGRGSKFRDPSTGRFTKGPS